MSSVALILANRSIIFNITHDKIQYAIPNSNSLDIRDDILSYGSILEFIINLEAFKALVKGSILLNFWRVNGRFSIGILTPLRPISNIEDKFNIILISLVTRPILPMNNPIEQAENTAEINVTENNGIEYIGILIPNKITPVNNPIITVNIPSNIWNVDFERRSVNLLVGEAIKSFNVPRLLSDTKLAPTPKKAFQIQSTKAFPIIKGVTSMSP